MTDVQAQNQDDVVKVDATVEQEAPVETVEMLESQLKAIQQKVTVALMNTQLDQLATLGKEYADVNAKLLVLQNENLKPIIAELVKIGKSGLTLHSIACKMDADYKKKFGKEEGPVTQTEMFEKPTTTRVSNPVGDVYFARRAGDDKVYACSNRVLSTEMKSLVGEEENMDRFHKDRDTEGYWANAFMRPGGHLNNINDVWSGKGIKPKWVVENLAKIQGTDSDQNKLTKIRKNPEQYKDLFIVLTPEQCAKINFSKLDNIARPKK